jgi:DNA invertase Pin-like site-specific DNA recombinase
VLNLKIGYIRISTHEQNEQIQRDTLAFCDRIFFEITSGFDRDLPGLDRAIASLKKGDTFCVWRLDRIGRSTKHLLSVIEEIQAAKAHFQSLTEGFDTTTTAGRRFFGFASGLSEFERSIIVERTKVGLIEARLRGRVGGRPKRTLSPKEIETAQVLRENGQTVKEVCDLLQIGRSIYYSQCYSGGRDAI